MAEGKKMVAYIRGGVLGAVGGVALSIGAVAVAQKFEDDRIDISNGFRLLCEGVEPTQNEAVFRQEIKPGYEIEIGEVVIKGVEGGKLNVSESVSFSGGGQAYIEENGRRYTIESITGPHQGTEVTIATRCERF